MTTAVNYLPKSAKRIDGPALLKPSLNCGSCEDCIRTNSKALVSFLTASAIPQGFLSAIDTYVLGFEPGVFHRVSTWSIVTKLDTDFSHYLEIHLCSMVTLTFIFQIQSKLLVFGAVSTTSNDQGCQHVTGRYESIRLPLSKSAGWPTFVHSHLSVKTVEWFKYRLSHNFPTFRKEEN